MIRRTVVTLAVACAAVVLAPTLMASESAAASNDAPSRVAKAFPKLKLKRSGYIVASS